MKTLIAAAAMAALSFCGIANAQEYSLRFSTSQVNPNEPIIKAMKTYAERVGERSGGRIAITVMTGDQLGAQKKVNEMVMSGASLLSATDYGQLGQFVPDLSILAGPYVYPDLAATDRLFASDLYKDLSGTLEARGIKIIMPNGLFGYRHIIANKPVRSPADLAGVTIRVPSSPIMMATFGNYGARPTELPWGDVYNALQTGVVDAAEGPFGSIAGAKLNETRKVISKTGHQIMFTAWVASSQFFNSLPEDLQTILLEEGQTIAKELTQMTLETDDAYAKQLAASGVEIVTDVDIPSFIEASRAAYEKVPNITPGIYDQVQKAMAE
ncbi:C4-dicarboxylate TRAP transporter substrate-binding protein [Sinorhizobium meliloti]|uniref:C4-dicarboxylate TRAP transporter substrate-binding protein n=1 Tax=Rhizobium meliloti TaxID=382 RepID=UPI00028616B7|nr:C4-dicarboxylate TRAP transporter substrate-binding protein [Sinorhizobium meliloti]ASP68728.1 C4-dicarboxylate ABC transporter [Sinorhizobium meliloti]ASP82536.1 C4-dicarboxylate ABC transporter [Sinorhizobium meliloti]KKA13607.1 C4-dicarboxylate ABC transporter [Sinorhizobium meliloti]MQW17465.1 C4-dicarboxylate ABC transporter [Sinorhizobium meliloti]MQX03254.1 C4-dicarboxylate ABC transporter [Sinorhizobium meliloti]